MADRTSTLTLALIDKVSGPGAAAGRALTQLGVSANNLKGVLAGLGIAFGAAELARLGKESVQVYAAHEQGMLRLRHLYGVNAAQMEAAHKRMQEVGFQYGIVPDEVEAAMSAYGELGYSLDQSLRSLPRAAKSAELMNTQIARTAGLEPLMAKAGIKNLDQAYEDLYNTSLHVRGGFAGMEVGLQKIIPMLPNLKWGNDEGFRRMLAYVRAVAPAVGGVENAIEGFLAITSKAGTKRIEKPFKEAFGQDFDLYAELQKAKDPVARFIELSDQAANKLGSVGRLFPNDAMQRWFKGLHANMSEVNASINRMRQARGQMDKDANEAATSTQRKLNQLNTAWINFKENLGASLVDMGLMNRLQGLADAFMAISTIIEQHGFWPKIAPNVEAITPEEHAAQKKLNEERRAAMAAEPLSFNERFGMWPPVPLPRPRPTEIARALQQRGRVETAPAAIAAPPPMQLSPAPSAMAPLPRARPTTAPVAGVPPPVEPAPIDLSDALNRVPDAAQAAGAATGQAYNSALGMELNRSVKMISEFTDWAAKALGFRATPQIAPSFSTATGRQGPASRADSLSRGAFSDVGPVPAR